MLQLVNEYVGITDEWDFNFTTYKGRKIFHRF